ncbi:MULTISPECIES: hypothetical protein [Arthrospira]|uniref:hypothetical protein n=1 Tax=Limnospira TaxID=2596745 RepID=UPI0001C38B28|nr:MULTISPECIES: hypothetical protein [Arthrospira]AMW30176.1 hypothetical protein AP285_21835 [Arthrospira platensis YZ]KDR54128.1 hypothetical protein APPUASWS_031810 [Arthrospira platensis str. Paraca]MBD2670499.1 hypothetical protein [Arthrospira platensis FACHB-439]MBD2711773.1 hypothetical protein [Arthrospira platensis FACHB-835]MDT9183616.1 hypothetical protein [Limnospira sp. PMC 289.06]MDT9311498.1 hypothetical protein [Limnospira sp. Paracas R14]QQW28140.1 hypothetical protein AP9
MNIYFLVEGNSTEKKIYPKWLSYLVPELTRVKYHDQVQKNNYYLISGEGYPAILHDGLDNAIDKIRETNNYDYLVICVDADEETVDARLNDVQKKSQDRNIGNTKIKIIVQNRCIETWLLGNRKIFDSRQPLESPLLDYVNYYDVSQDDPEAMGSYNNKNHAEFHGEYLKEIFRAKNICYTKRNPGDAREKHYLQELQKRTAFNGQHLKSFQTFLSFCEMIKTQIST